MFRPAAIAINSLILMSHQYAIKAVHPECSWIGAVQVGRLMSGASKGQSTPDPGDTLKETSNSLEISAESSTHPSFPEHPPGCQFNSASQTLDRFWYDSIT